jgi:heme A synthase
LQFDIIVPVIMGCAMLWWISRGLSWTHRLVAAAVTLAVIIAVVLFERSDFRP